MAKEQGTLFDTRKLRGQKAQSFVIEPPTPDMTVNRTLPAYHTYLSSGGYSETTPDDYVADLKLFGQFTTGRPLKAIKSVDVKQWIAQLKEAMVPKTVSRKVSAVGNYFKWLADEHVLDDSIAKSIRAPKVTAPLPDILYESECEKLLAVASDDPRTYLLVLLLLETGIKSSELMNLQTSDFDFSNKYQPELWVKHGSKHTHKDRKLKLPSQITEVFSDYTERYKASGVLFPYSDRFVTMLLADAAKRAEITKKVNAGLLRDMFVIHCRKKGEEWDAIFQKIGLSKNSYDDARKKYGRLTQEAL